MAAEMSSVDPSAVLASITEAAQTSLNSKQQASESELTTHSCCVCQLMNKVC